jgi:hypothetical protein
MDRALFGKMNLDRTSELAIPHDPILHEGSNSLHRYSHRLAPLVVWGVMVAFDALLNAIVVVHRSGPRFVAILPTPKAWSNNTVFFIPVTTVDCQNMLPEINNR